MQTAFRLDISGVRLMKKPRIAGLCVKYLLPDIWGYLKMAPHHHIGLLHHPHIRCVVAPGKSREGCCARCLIRAAPTGRCDGPGKRRDGGLGFDGWHAGLIQHIRNH